jgi:uncharacterized protein (DUF58 family)
MLFNLTVVYFAFGAPLGVYGVIRSKGTSPRALAANFVQFLLWPLFAAASVRKVFVFQPPQTSLERQVDALRAEFEVEIDAALLPEFRNSFARYTGLALAAVEPNDDRAAKSLLKAAGGDSHLASACLTRRNRRRLEFHLLLARNDLNDILEKNDSQRVKDVTRRLADLLDDTCLH